MTYRIVLFALFLSILAGCSGEPAPTVEKGNAPIKEGAGETKTQPIVNDSGP